MTGIKAILRRLTGGHQHEDDPHSALYHCSSLPHAHAPGIGSQHAQAHACCHHHHPPNYSNNSTSVLSVLGHDWFHHSKFSHRATHAPEAHELTLIPAAAETVSTELLEERRHRAHVQVGMVTLCIAYWKSALEIVTTLCTK